MVIFCGDVGDYAVICMADQEASRVDAVTVVDNALRGGLFSLSLEPHRHSELVHFVVGKPSSQEGNLE